MIPLTKKEEKMHHKQKVCYIYKKGFSINEDYKKYFKVKDHCHYAGKYIGATHNICNLRYKISKEIPVVLHDGSTYDYHFIIKELAEKVEGEFECLGGTTEKYITFSVPIKIQLDNGKKITYKLKFIDSFKFISTSLSGLANNLSDGLYNDKCIDFKSCHDYTSTKDNQLIFKCIRCSKNHKKHFNKDLIKRFAIPYEFCDKDLNKFILLLRKGVCPYDYMIAGTNLMKHHYPTKKIFIVI